ncbi:MAG: acetyl-CoA carboxylase biotin carboxyl carrier protein [Pseudomonadota bacterium]
MSGFDIDDELIRRLADLMAEKGLSEIELEDQDRRLRVSRTTQVTTVSMPAAAAGGPAPANTDAGTAPAASPDEGVVTSPMVGTVYVSPEPGSPPYVEEGSQVAEGDTLMIVEAMKVMNPIRAPRAGTVSNIKVKNAQPVEFGEALLTIS